MRLPDTPSVISSPASVVGREHCDSLNGAMTDLFGRPLALVNHSQKTEGTGAGKILATFGRFSSGSSRTVALQRYLENNLHLRLPLDGSTAYAMTWKKLITPSGRRYCRLAVSERRMSGRDFGGWPTLNTEGWRSDGELRLLSKICENANEYLVLSHRACRSKQERWWTRGELPKKSHGRINPDLYRWLMGFPPEWDQALSAGDTETR